MKVVIAGSRTIEDWGVVQTAIKESGFRISEVVCGGAQGVDNIGAGLAELHGVRVKYFYPDWKKSGRAAGPIRNREMAEYADALIAVWDGESRGTKNMIDEMKARNKPYFVKIVRPSPDDSPEAA